MELSIGWTRREWRFRCLGLNCAVDSPPTSQKFPQQRDGRRNEKLTKAGRSAGRIRGITSDADRLSKWRPPWSWRFRRQPTRRAGNIASSSIFIFQLCHRTPWFAGAAPRWGENALPGTATGAATFFDDGNESGAEDVVWRQVALRERGLPRAGHQPGELR